MKLIARAVLPVAVLVLAATSAQAIPTTFNFTSGSVTITASTSLTNQTVLSATVPLDGVFVEFDAAANAGNGALTDFHFSVPQTPTLSISNFGQYENLVIESATIQPGAGFGNLFNLSQGGGVYTFLAGPTNIDGVYSVTDADAILPPQNNVPISVTDSSLINGTVDVDAMTLELLGITLATIPGALFGETEDLVVKGDIMFVGAIPEPGTAALLSLGVVSLAIRSRNRRQS